MLFTVLIGGLVQIINYLTAWMPTVQTLPFGIDAILTTGMGYVHFIGGVFPPITSMLEGFLFYYAFKLVLKLVAMFPIIRGMLHK